ncbi:transposable element Tcb2 transposase [Trichonephila clavipes]|nr:transposable element Tcb2 transposase [Trichonephila clavipes]
MRRIFFILLSIFLVVSSDSGIEKKVFCNESLMKEMEGIDDKAPPKTRQRGASVLFTEESRFTLKSDSGRLLIWREQSTRYHESNTVEKHSYRGGGKMVWAGISLGGPTDLYVFWGGTLTGVRYRDEILDPYVHPYAVAIGNDFILMDDNARPHRAVIVDEYLEGLERIECPARSPD